MLGVSRVRRRGADRGEHRRRNRDHAQLCQSRAAPPLSGPDVAPTHASRGRGRDPAGRLCEHRHARGRNQRD